jgi:hypothetical protein
MKIKLSDGTILNIGQNKITKEKVIYKLKNNEWILIFSGNIINLKKEIKKLKMLSDKRVTRKIIADICGTSYSAACKDMGITKI